MLVCALNHNGRLRALNQQSGFTLVEMVAVIVLLGILAVGSSSFIRSSAEIYRDTTRRDTLVQQGRFAVERISRELRNALPGSIRVSSSGAVQCIEFIPVIAASSYLGAVADSAAAGLQAVDFPYSYNGGDRVAIYTVGSNDVYAALSNRVTTVSGVSAALANQRTLTFASPHQFAEESPRQRFYIYHDAVSFCASDNSLQRYQGYALSPSALTPPLTGGRMLAENIRLNDGASAVTVFGFTPGTTQRAGVVHLDLRFSDDSASDEWLRFSQEVFVRNTP